MFKLTLNSQSSKHAFRESGAGFTLVEIMTVVVVFAVILSSVVALTTDKTPREDLESKARQVVDIISRAHNYAMSGYHGDAWGVKIFYHNATNCGTPGTGACVIIFKGMSYASRNSAYDEKVVFNTGAYLDPSQDNEYYFKKGSGWLASTTVISDQALIIRNNFDAQKTVTTTLTGLVYFGN